MISPQLSVECHDEKTAPHEAPSVTLEPDLQTPISTVQPSQQTSGVAKNLHLSSTQCYLCFCTVTGETGTPSEMPASLESSKMDVCIMTLLCVWVLYLYMYMYIRIAV